MFAEKVEARSRRGFRPNRSRSGLGEQIKRRASTSGGKGFRRSFDERPKHRTSTEFEKFRFGFRRLSRADQRHRRFETADVSRERSDENN